MVRYVRWKSEKKEWKRKELRSTVLYRTSVDGKAIDFSGGDHGERSAIRIRSDVTRISSTPSGTHTHIANTRHHPMQSSFLAWNPAIKNWESMRRRKELDQ
jgi:hypothetical protein